MGLWGDIGSIAGGAIGSVLLPGIGTGLGASLGGALGGAADGPADNGGEYQGNKYDPMIQSTINRLINSHEGRDAAGAAAGKIQQNLKGELEDFKNQPGYGTNAAVTSAFTNKASVAAEGSISDALIKGAGLDTQTAASATGLAQNMSSEDYKRWLEMKQRKQTLSQQPSFLDQLGRLGGTAAFGQLVSGGAGSDTEGSSSGSDNTGSYLNTLANKP